MRTFSVLSQFEAAGSEILEFSGLVPDIVHGTEFELLPGAVDAALQSIANVSVSSELQDTLLRAGVLWYAGGCPISFDRRYLFKPSLSLSLSLRIQSWVRLSLGTSISFVTLMIGNPFNLWLS
ncbi:hypothetical protein AHAS_Ahas11G0322000 [Arachis hypogaea]